MNPPDEAGVVAALAFDRGRVLPLAGGTDLLALMKDAIVAPDRLVNLKNLDAALGVVEPASSRAPQDLVDPGRVMPEDRPRFRIGAAATLVDLAEHAGARAVYPALTDAAAAIGTPQIRHSATVGGNLLQRPRCWYFRNEEFHCLKKGGSRCHAVEGENQFHAIFGDGPCHMVHPSSLAVPILAYGGRFRVIGPSGAREIDAEAFFQLPNANLYGESVLQRGEILTHVVLPYPGELSAIYEVRFKQAHDWPLASAAVNLAMEGNVVRTARVVLGAVAPIPWRVPAAERALIGRALTESAALDAAASALAGAKALSGNGYKIQIARTAVRRAILRAADRPRD